MTQNGKVVRETVTTDGTVTAVMDFIYDESGRPFALRHSTNGSSFTTYYYVVNLQGDVVKLITASGATVAEYTYNAWGEVLTSTGEKASINPLRYRGYYYDTETGFYYLQSRYYDPANHRFLNADIFTSTDDTNAIACNMFAYCNNNPVNRTDEVGTVSSSTEDNNNNGIPDYLEIRWREQTIKAKNNLSLDQETGFTVIAGTTLRAAIGVSVSISAYYAFDMHGNLAIYISPGIGGGFPSASIGAFAGAVFAPDANNIGGLGFAIGGSLCEGLKGGGDYIMAVDQEHQRTYHGGSLAFGGGASAPVPAEVHGEVTFSFKLYSVNILELLR